MNVVSHGLWYISGDTECYFNFPITVSCTYIPTLDIDVADER